MFNVLIQIRAHSKDREQLLYKQSTEDSDQSEVEQATEYTLSEVEVHEFVVIFTVGLAPENSLDLQSSEVESLHEDRVECGVISRACYQIDLVVGSEQ